MASVVHFQKFWFAEERSARTIRTARTALTSCLQTQSRLRLCRSRRNRWALIRLISSSSASISSSRLSDCDLGPSSARILLSAFSTESFLVSAMMYASSHTKSCWLAKYGTANTHQNLHPSLASSDTRRPCATLSRQRSEAGVSVSSWERKCRSWPSSRILPCSWPGPSWHASGPGRIRTGFALLPARHWP
jgi:hypothetical protein